MPVAQTFTARSALAIGRAAYVALLDRAMEGADHRGQRVARHAFERGYESLIALEANASDVQLSGDAEEAFAAYVHAVKTAAGDAALMWLDLFPEVMRDVRRDADLPVQIQGQSTIVVAAVVRARASRQPEPPYQPQNKQQALALAA